MVLRDISGTVTAGGTAQNAAPAWSSRSGFWIQNQSSGDLYVSGIGTASAGPPALRVPPGGYYESAGHNAAPTGAISVFGATTGQAWAGREWA